MVVLEGIKKGGALSEIKKVDKPLVSFSEAECEDCDWKGNIDEMEWSEEDDTFQVCPLCGSDKIYYC